MGKQLSVVGLSPFDLLVHRCECGELSVDGFYHQTERRVDADNYKVTLHCPCRECGLVYVRHFRLTAGRGHRRIINWYALQLPLLRVVPRRWFFPVARAFQWLQRRVRL